MVCIQVVQWLASDESICSMILLGFLCSDNKNMKRYIIIYTI
jgi:hypothetical protein